MRKMTTSEKFRNCTQTKCAYFQMGVGCKACDCCGAEPYILDDNCYRCWNCCKDAGILRWNDDKDEIEEKQLQLVKMK